jgi:hypothetical protein
MNRADKARNYLSERLTQFNNLSNLANSKNSFFDSIIHFRKTIIIGLTKFKIFGQNDIDELDRLLSGMEMYRGKGGPDPKVYPSSWDGYGKIHSKISELIAFTERVQIPWYYILKDFLCSRALLIPIIAVLVAAIIQLILH